MYPMSAAGCLVLAEGFSFIVSGRLNWTDNTAAVAVNQFLKSPTPTQNAPAGWLKLFHDEEESEWVRARKCEGEWIKKSARGKPTAVWSRVFPANPENAKQEKAVHTRVRGRGSKWAVSSMRTSSETISCSRANRRSLLRRRLLWGLFVFGEVVVADCLVDSAYCDGECVCM